MQGLALRGRPQRSAACWEEIAGLAEAAFRRVTPRLRRTLPADDDLFDTGGTGVLTRLWLRACAASPASVERFPGREDPAGRARTAAVMLHDLPHLLSAAGDDLEALREAQQLAADLGRLALDEAARIQRAERHASDRRRKLADQRTLKRMARRAARGAWAF